MSLKVIAIGKDHEDWVRTGIERYQKRCKKPYDIEWVLLPADALNPATAPENESERILSRLTSRDYVIVLDERGDMLDTPALSKRIETQLTAGRQLVFVIGGAYGVSDVLRQRADLVWSLSDLVFPHQLVRLVLTEQLYRAQEIARGGKYHHE